MAILNQMHAEMIVFLKSVPPIYSFLVGAVPINNRTQIRKTNFSKLGTNLYMMGTGLLNCGYKLRLLLKGYSDKATLTRLL